MTPEKICDRFRDEGLSGEWLSELPADTDWKRLDKEARYIAERHQWLSLYSDYRAMEASHNVAAAWADKSAKK